MHLFIYKLVFDFLPYQGHPELENLRAAHYQWLSETAQEEKAGEVRRSKNYNFYCEYKFINNFNNDLLLVY